MPTAESLVVIWPQILVALVPNARFDASDASFWTPSDDRQQAASKAKDVARIHEHMVRPFAPGMGM
jgi:hypothetical protein